MSPSMDCRLQSLSLSIAVGWLLVEFDRVMSEGGSTPEEEDRVK